MMEGVEANEAEIDRVRDAAIIRTVRKQKRLTQRELADKVGTSEPTIRRLEKGNPEVSMNLWADVAKFFGLEFDWASGHVIAGSSIPAAAIAREAMELGRVPSTESAKEVPAGFEVIPGATRPIPTWDIDVSANAWVDVPICSLDYNDPRQRTIVDTGRFRLKIKGHCMEPVYRSGVTLEFEILRIDRQPLELLGDYVVCKNDGTGTFKRLIAMDEDALTLAAINQAEFPGEIVVARQEVARLAVMKHILTDRPKPEPFRVRKRKGPRNG